MDALFWEFMQAGAYYEAIREESRQAGPAGHAFSSGGTPGK
jgi:hypothetical protein